MTEPLARDACAEADERELEQLYDYYFPRVYNFILGRVRSHADAGELTSRVFEKALGRISSYNPQKAGFSTWLFTIAGNTVSDYYRMRRKCVLIPIEALWEVPSEQPSMEENLERSENRQFLCKALLELPDRERRIVALKFRSGLTNRRIAKIVGLSESNVAVILYRSVRRLRQLMETDL
jgi:RNA polymerase sigma-70 factor (ECF subfamily)